jgi:hypothetical protein
MKNIGSLTNKYKVILTLSFNGNWIMFNISKVLEYTNSQTEGKYIWLTWRLRNLMTQVKCLCSTALKFLSDLKEERFILAHGFSPGLLDRLLWACCSRVHPGQCPWWKKPVHLMAVKKQRQKEEGAQVSISSSGLVSWWPNFLTTPKGSITSK